MDTVDWSILQAFLVLARDQRLTTAAKRAGVDHTTLKRRITALEKSLGVILFERKPSGYFMTEAGRHTLRIIEEMESASLKLSRPTGSDQEVRGVVRISAADVFGHSFLAPRLGRLTSRYPDLSVQLVTTPRPADLTKREADIAITPMRPAHGRLHRRKLIDYELGLYATQTYLNGSPELKSPKDLNRHKLVGYITDLLFQPELDYLARLGAGLKSSFSATNALCQLQAVRFHAGIGVLPCWIADEDERLIRLLPKQVAILRTFWLIVNSDMRDIAAVRLVGDFVVEEMSTVRAKFAPSRGAS